MLKGDIMSKHVAGMFMNRLELEQTLTDLRSIGINDDRISLVVSEDTHCRSFKLEESTEDLQGVTVGGFAGATIGGVIVALTTASAIIATGGLGLVVVGPMVVALAATGAGAITGGLLGALIGLGFDEQEAKEYDDAIKQGRILMLLENLENDEKMRVKQIMQQKVPMSQI